MKSGAKGQAPKGQALIELAIVLPLLLVLSLVLIQAAWLSEARGVVEYAAFVAARAAAVDGDAAQAARLVCVPITGLSGARRVWSGAAAGSGSLGGLSDQDRSRYAASLEKTRVRIAHLPHAVEAEVEHDWELIIPIAGRLMAMLTTESRRLTDRYGTPHLALRGMARLTDATTP